MSFFFQLSTYCLLALIACALGTHIEPILKQFQEAGGKGQYEYSYESGIEKKSEYRTPDGQTHGTYSYLDSNGVVQHVKYTAGVEGFKVESSNLPLRGANPNPHNHNLHHSFGSFGQQNAVIGETPEVIAARNQHAAAHAAALKTVPRLPAHHEPSHRGFPSHIAPAIHNGALVDTPEVAAAKAHHAAAHAEVRRVLPQLPQQPLSTHTHNFPSLHHAQPHHPVHHNNPGFTKFAEEIPRSALGETPEVAAAREAHLSYYAKVKAELPEESQQSRFPF